MSQTKMRVRKATSLLKEDHQAVKKLFQEYQKIEGAEGRGREAIFDRIKTLLTIHAQIEEEIFYPAVRQEVAGTEDLVEESVEEHNVVKSLLRELAAMSADDEEFDAGYAAQRPEQGLQWRPLVQVGRASCRERV